MVIYDAKTLPVVPEMGFGAGLALVEPTAIGLKPSSNATQRVRSTAVQLVSWSPSLRIQLLLP